MSIIRNQAPGWGTSALRPTATAESSALLRAHPLPAPGVVLAPNKGGRPALARSSGAGGPSAPTQRRTREHKER